MNRGDGPRRPTYPLAIIHPLGPLFRHLPLSLRRHLLFLRAHSTWGNFKKPRTWREKMQWRIINDHRTILILACDKLAQRTFVDRELRAAGKRAQVKIPEVFWVGTDVRELQFRGAELPSRWVLKPNHSSGRVRLLDAETDPIDWEELIAVGDLWMRKDEETQVFGHHGYEGARRLIIAEERVGAGAEAPDDVRLSCTSGKLRVAAWSRGYGTPGYKAAGYQDDLTTRVDQYLRHELRATEPTPLDSLTREVKDRLIEVAEVISAPIDHVRVDFYVESGTIWFSELTVYSNSGLAPIEHKENLTIGSYWNLPDLSAPDPREAEWRALLEGTPKGTLQR